MTLGLCMIQLNYKRCYIILQIYVSFALHRSEMVIMNIDTFKTVQLFPMIDLTAI